MKIVIVGGGPGGLYFALLMKKRYPDYDIAVYERNRADDTFGFGVVFSDETLDNLMDYDAPSYQAITREFSYWDEIDFHFHGEMVRSTGHGFCGTERRTLLLVLHARCRELGVKLHFSHEIADLEEFKDADLIVAADGVNSFIRERYKEHFQPDIELRRNHFIWLGTSAPTPAFSFHFTTNEFGIWDLCTYQYKQNMCTWVIEAPDTTWAKAEPVIGQWSEQETIAYLEDMWAHLLKGHKLVGNRSYWRRFPVIRNKNWYYKNIVLARRCAAHRAFLHRLRHQARHGRCDQSLTMLSMAHGPSRKRCRAFRGRAERTSRKPNTPPMSARCGRKTRRAIGAWSRSRPASACCRAPRR